MKRIGVMTGGGDCPGLNAVIRAVTKTAILEYGVEVVGIRNGYEGLIHAETMPLTVSGVSGILLWGGTVLGTSNTANPFKYAVHHENGKVEYEDRSRNVCENFEKLKLDGLVIIGGDGTLSSALKLSEMGLPVVGVPKTIDNDLAATDVTFGFDSALVKATEAVDALHTTGESHNRAMILEVMGRYAGWIALRSGMAGGGDVILIPEIPYDISKVCESIRERISKGKKFSIIIVAEGAKPAGGEMVVQQVIEGSPDPVRLGGIGHTIGRQIQLCSGLETRVTVLGHVQRGGIPTPFDRWLATRFGVEAAKLLFSGKTGSMVALRGRSVISVPLGDAVSELKRVDPAGEEVRQAKAVGTCFGAE
ncbi:MAG: 6-phosphofructokinase [Candidatus Omnitrophica bacterium]|nr:6-phosphofructokinase [Candidatus Omnitrophota bacterium]